MTLKAGKYFIVATGTDAGKTFLLSKICQKLREKNIACDAIKPVASGFLEGDLQSDSAQILQSLGQKFSIKNVENITPWRFNAPLAPSIAAKIENRDINFEELKNFCRDKILQTQSEFFFVEGAGGIMTPISDDKTFLDLICAIKIPVLLLSQNYLGAMSHTLCAVEVLKSCKIAIEAIIINDYQDSSVNIFDTIAEIKKFSSIKTVAIDDFLSEV